MWKVLTSLFVVSGFLCSDVKSHHLGISFHLLFGPLCCTFNHLEGHHTSKWGLFFSFTYSNKTQWLTQACFIFFSVRTCFMNDDYDCEILVDSRKGWDVLIIIIIIINNINNINNTIKLSLYMYMSQTVEQASLSQSLWPSLAAFSGNANLSPRGGNKTSLK